jgi:hypothetical protein
MQLPKQPTAESRKWLPVKSRLIVVSWIAFIDGYLDSLLPLVGFALRIPSDKRSCGRATIASFS